MVDFNYQRSIVLLTARIKGNRNPTHTSQALIQLPIHFPGQPLCQRYIHGRQKLNYGCSQIPIDDLTFVCIPYKRLQRCFQTTTVENRLFRSFSLYSLFSNLFYVYFIKMPALKKKQRASRRPANMGPSSDQEKFISLDSSRFHCDVRGQKHCAQTFFQIRSRSFLSFRLSLSFGFDDFLDIRSKFSRRQSDRSMPTSPFPKYQKVVTHS